MLAFATLVETRRDLAVLTALIWLIAVALGLVGMVQYLGDGTRASGYVGDPNFFASFQLIALPMAIVLANLAERTDLRVAVYAGAAIIAGSVLSSLSRGGLLGLGAVVLLMCAQPAHAAFRTRARKRAFMLAVLTGAGLLLGAAYGELRSRSDSVFASSDAGSGRTYLWSAAWTAWREHPLLGIGYGEFEAQSNDLLLRTPAVDLGAYRLRPGGQPVHNSYLESLTELGVPGLTLFVALLASCMAGLRRTARRAAAVGDAFVAMIARALIIALAAYSLTSFFLSSQTSRALWLLLGLSLALPRLVAEGPLALPQGPRSHHADGQQP
jgi:O-antigen ligase